MCTLAATQTHRPQQPGGGKSSPISGIQCPRFVYPQHRPAAVVGQGTNRCERPQCRSVCCARCFAAIHSRASTGRGGLGCCKEDPRWAAAAAAAAVGLCGCRASEAWRARGRERQNWASASPTAGAPRGGGGSMGLPLPQQQRHLTAQPVVAPRSLLVHAWMAPGSAFMCHCPPLSFHPPTRLCSSTRMSFIDPPAAPSSTAAPLPLPLPSSPPSYQPRPSSCPPLLFHLMTNSSSHPLTSSPQPPSILPSPSTLPLPSTIPPPPPPPASSPSPHLVVPSTARRGQPSLSSSSSSSPSSSPYIPDKARSAPPSPSNHSSHRSSRSASSASTPICLCHPAVSSSSSSPPSPFSRCPVHCSSSSSSRHGQRSVPSSPRQRDGSRAGSRASEGSRSAAKTEVAPATAPLSPQTKWEILFDTLLSL